MSALNSFKISSKWVNPNKTLFAPLNTETVQSRIYEKVIPCITVLGGGQSSNVGTDYITFVFEKYIGRVSCVYNEFIEIDNVIDNVNDLDSMTITMNHIVQFDYWYDNAFTRLLRAEATLSICHQDLLALMPEPVKLVESKSYHDHFDDISTVFNVVLINPTDLISKLVLYPDSISREKYDRDVEITAEYELKTGILPGSIRRRGTSVI